MGYISLPQHITSWVNGWPRLYGRDDTNFVMCAYKCPQLLEIRLWVELTNPPIDSQIPIIGRLRSVWLLLEAG